MEKLPGRGCGVNSPIGALCCPLTAYSEGWVEGWAALHGCVIIVSRMRVDRNSRARPGMDHATSFQAQNSFVLLYIVRDFFRPFFCTVTDTMLLVMIKKN